MNPVNGQVIDNSSKLGSLLDTKGKNLKFKKDNDVDNDLCYVAKGSDGRTYSAQLQRQSLIVSVYATPEEKIEKKAIEDRGAKLVQGEKVTGTNKDIKKIQEPVKEGSKDKKELDKIVNDLDKPVFEKENKNKYTSFKK